MGNVLDDLKKQIASIQYYSQMQKLFIAYIFKNLEIFTEQVTNHHLINEFQKGSLINNFGGLGGMNGIGNVGGMNPMGMGPMGNLVGMGNIHPSMANIAMHMNQSMLGGSGGIPNMPGLNMNDLNLIKKMSNEDGKNLPNMGNMGSMGNSNQMKNVLQGQGKEGMGMGKGNPMMNSSGGNQNQNPNPNQNMSGMPSSMGMNNMLLEQLLKGKMGSGNMQQGIPNMQGMPNLQSGIHNLQGMQSTQPSTSSFNQNQNPMGGINPLLLGLMQGSNPLGGQSNPMSNPLFTLQHSNPQLLQSLLGSGGGNLQSMLAGMPGMNSGMQQIPTGMQGMGLSNQNPNIQSLLQGMNQQSGFPNMNSLNHPNIQSMLQSSGGMQSGQMNKAPPQKMQGNVNFNQGNPQPQQGFNLSNFMSPQDNIPNSQNPLTNNFQNNQNMPLNHQTELGCMNYPMSHEVNENDHKDMLNSDTKDKGRPTMPNDKLNMDPNNLMNYLNNINPEQLYQIQMLLAANNNRQRDTPEDNQTNEDHLG